MGSIRSRFWSKGLSASSWEMKEILIGKVRQKKERQPIKKGSG